MVEGRRRILVVEDDSETAEQLVEFLSTNGYQIDLAGDGNDGLSRGRSADYAVITIDRMLPDMDGIAIIRRLEACKGYRTARGREPSGLDVRRGEVHAKKTNQ
jgi:DNA-binding response OmpR family regulator